MQNQTTYLMNTSVGADSNGNIGNQIQDAASGPYQRFLISTYVVAALGLPGKYHRSLEHKFDILMLDNRIIV